MRISARCRRRIGGLEEVNVKNKIYVSRAKIIGTVGYFFIGIKLKSYMNKAIYLPISFILCSILSFVVDKLSVMLLFIPLFFAVLSVHITFENWLNNISTYGKHTSYGVIFADSCFASFMSCIGEFTYSYVNNLPVITVIDCISITSFTIFIVSFAILTVVKKKSWPQ